MERQEEIKRVRTRFEKRAHGIRKLVEKLKPHIGKPKLNHRDSRKVVSKVNKLVSKKGVHVWKSWEDPDVDLIESLAPVGGRCYKELNLQRFRVHHEDIQGSLRSFAWMRRGVPKAQAMALKQMWAWEQQAHGTPCPLPDELLQLAT